jgi:CHAT domain-containing protein/tetratricopeptide (TPR) repeat protein
MEEHPRPKTPRRSTSARRSFEAARTELEKARSADEQAAALLRMIDAARGFDPRQADVRERDLLLAGMQRDLAELLHHLGQGDRSIEAFAQAARLFAALDMKPEWAETQLAIALTFSGDLPQREDLVLQAYERALTVFTAADHPQAWALIQSNLVGLYVDLRRGDRAQNLEKALQHGQAALRVRTRTEDPDNWAVTQQLLAYAWLNRRLGRPDQNAARAIEAGEAALTVLSPDRHAQFWASLHLTLSSAYFERAQGERLADLDLAIASARKAMTVYTRDAAPDDWVSLQLNLTKACRDRNRSPDDPYLGWAIDAAAAALDLLSSDTEPDRWADAQLSLAAALALQQDGDGFARARDAIDAVLRALPRDAYPYLWARANSALGVLLFETADGAPERLRLAVAAFERSLEVWTRDKYPEEWAGTQRNLAGAYREGGTGDHFDKAVAALNAVLSIHDRERQPDEWSAAMRDLGDVYMSRGRAADVEQAIAMFRQSLEVADRANDPELWGATQARLGEAYLARALGVRRNNVALARQALEAAAAALSKERDPLRWGHVQLSLGAAYYYDRSERANMERALRAARDAETVITRSNDPAAWAKLKANLAAVYLEQPTMDVDKLAALAIEAATDALQVFDPARNPSEWILTQRNLASAHHRSSIFTMGRSAHGDHLAAAQKAYEAALGATPRESRARERLLTLAGLVQVLADRDDWPAVERVSDDAISTAELLIGESLHEEEQSEIVSRASYAAALGAFAAARRDDSAAAWSRLERVRARLLSIGLRVDERALPAARRAELQRLRERLRTVEAVETLETSSQRQAIRSEIARLRALAGPAPGANAPLPETPVVTMAVTRSGGAILVRGGGRDVIGLIDQRSGPVILAQMLGSLSTGKDAHWDWVGGKGAEEVAGKIAAPLWPTLEAAGIPSGSRIVWIPPYQFSHAPLVAARHPVTGENLIDRYEVVQAPSLAAWTIAAGRARERAGAPRRLAGIFNPTGDLPYAETEKVLVSGVAPKLAMDIAARGIDANALLEKFSAASIWHFATHGRFDWSDFRRSGLELGRGADGRSNRLTTEDLLYGTPGITPTVVLLTACESGLGDLKESPNESLGLPAAFLQAGAAGVIAAMWKVEDLSAALLAAKFYDAYLNHGLAPAAALRSAQLWLRSSTGAALLAFVRGLQARVESPTRAREFEPILAALSKLPARECPFADVERWGAFIYVGG